MAKEFFKNLPDTTTPLNAQRMNSLLNGEESMGSIVVEDITCKNLCPGVSQGYYLTTAGTSFGRTTTDNGLVIKVEENTDYTISTTDTQERYRIAFTNTLLSIGGNSSDIYNALTKDGTKESITRNSGAYKYLIVNATDLTKIQVEKGSVATEYVEHKDFGKESVTDWVTLNSTYGLQYRKVGNDVEINLAKGNASVDIAKNGMVELGTLPSGYRPTVNTFIPIAYAGSEYGCLRLLIYSTGVISLQNLSSNSLTFNYASTFTRYSTLNSTTSTASVSTE